MSSILDLASFYSACMIGFSYFDEVQSIAERDAGKLAVVLDVDTEHKKLFLKIDGIEQTFWIKPADMELVPFSCLQKLDHFFENHILLPLKHEIIHLSSHTCRYTISSNLYLVQSGLRLKAGGGDFWKLFFLCAKKKIFVSCEI